MAIQETISNFTIGLAFDNTPPGVGTGTFVKVNERRFVLTANHNLKGASLDQIRLLPKPAGSIKEATMKEAAEQFGLVASTGLKVRFKEAVLTNAAADIALLELLPEAVIPPPAEFYALDGQSDFAIQDGASIILVGFPVANSVELAAGNKVVGAASEVGAFDSTLNDLPGLPSSYDPSEQFLLRYSRLEDGLEPHGFSGAGAWCHFEPKGPIWDPNPRLTGVQVAFHRPNCVLVITRLKTVLELAGTI